MGCDALKCSSLLCKGGKVYEFLSTFSMLSSSVPLWLHWIFFYQFSYVIVGHIRFHGAIVHHTCCGYRHEVRAAT